MPFHEEDKAQEIGVDADWQGFFGISGCASMKAEMLNGKMTKENARWGLLFGGNQSSLTPIDF